VEDEMGEAFIMDRKYEMQQKVGLKTRSEVTAWKSHKVFGEYKMDVCKTGIVCK
jgi:hypothetical protein